MTHDPTCRCIWCASDPDSEHTPGRTKTMHWTLNGELLILWHTNPHECLHKNDHVCPTCDFDGYYARAYPGCPWIDKADEVVRVDPSQQPTLPLKGLDLFEQLALPML